MRVAIVTLFPEMLRALTDYGITRRAVANQLLELKAWNPREFTQDKHHTVDDRPYGGGPGMVMMIEPLQAAIEAAKGWLCESSASETDSLDGRQSDTRPIKVIYLSPQGKVIKQSAIVQFAQEVQTTNILLIAGRYEGIDERLIQKEVDEEWSIGDYVLSGGELPAMVLLDALIRLLPSALGHEKSAQEDSFSDGLLDYPHYTRPENYNDELVPSVLLSGNHEAIRKWRMQQSLERTINRRPDLLIEKLKSNELTPEQQKILSALNSKKNT